jgi:hypothetical protein
VNTFLSLSQANDEFENHFIFKNFATQHIARKNEEVGVNPPMTPTSKAQPLRARLPNGKPFVDLSRTLRTL